MQEGPFTHALSVSRTGFSEPDSETRETDNPKPENPAWMRNFWPSQMPMSEFTPSSAVDEQGKLSEVGAYRSDEKNCPSP